MPFYSELLYNPPAVGRLRTVNRGLPYKMVQPGDSDKTAAAKVSLERVPAQNNTYGECGPKLIPQPVDSSDYPKDSGLDTRSLPFLGKTDSGDDHFLTPEEVMKGDELIKEKESLPADDDLDVVAIRRFDLRDPTKSLLFLFIKTAIKFERSVWEDDALGSWQQVSRHVTRGLSYSTGDGYEFQPLNNEQFERYWDNGNGELLITDKDYIFPDSRKRKWKRSSFQNSESWQNPDNFPKFNDDVHEVKQPVRKIHHLEIQPTKKHVIMPGDNVLRICYRKRHCAFTERAKILSDIAIENGFDVIIHEYAHRKRFYVYAGGRVILDLDDLSRPYSPLTCLDLGYTVLDMMLGLGWKLKPGRKMPKKNCYPEDWEDKDDNTPEDEDTTEDDTTRRIGEAGGETREVKKRNRERVVPEKKKGRIIDHKVVKGW